jgi:hypothetical protein
MKVFLFVLLGLVAGAIVGGLHGLGAGLLGTSAFNTTCFEGYCAMLVLFRVRAGGIVLGALAGAILLGWWAAHRRRT